MLALISGGKDSIYNICRCIDQGHEIVALGNLYNACKNVLRQFKEIRGGNWIVTCIRLSALMLL